MSTSLPATLDSLGPAGQNSSGPVLLAEDDAMFRRILQSWLEGWGHQVIVAEDGAKAWNILQQEHPPELLILDWVMPGIERIGTVPQNPEAEDVPISIHSAGNWEG